MYFIWEKYPERLKLRVFFLLKMVTVEPVKHMKIV
jgi:hypothetical protein